MKSAVQGRVVINLAKQRGSEDEDEDELVWWGDGGICKNVSVLVSGVTKKSFVSNPPTVHVDLYIIYCLDWSMVSTWY